MTQRIIDVFKAVEIEHRDRRRAVRCSAWIYQRVEIAPKSFAVWQPCQLIVMSEIFQLVFSFLAFSDVSQRIGDASQAIGIIHRRGSEADIHERTVFASASHLNVSENLAG